MPQDLERFSYLANYAPPEVRAEVVQTLRELAATADTLGLADEPNDLVRVSPGVALPGRPVGAVIPIYRGDEEGLDELTFPKTLFNLQALLGIKPPPGMNR